MQYRQGDLLFVNIEKLPDDARLLAGDAVERGSVTGHAHRIEKGVIYESWRGRYIVAQVGCRLLHDEHSVIELPDGIYQVIRQREYGGSYVQD